MSLPTRCATCGAVVSVDPDATARHRCPNCASPLPQSDFPGLPSTLLETFDVECMIGEGVSGVVYLARERATGERRALKVLTGAGAELAERFRREGRALIELDHPHVVRVYQLVEADGHPYLVCEYLPGGTLRAEMRTAGRVEPGRATQVLRDLLHGLLACHERGIVHRDV